ISRSGTFTTRRDAVVHPSGLAERPPRRPDKEHAKVTTMDRRARGRVCARAGRGVLRGFAVQINLLSAALCVSLRSLRLHVFFAEGRRDTQRPAEKNLIILDQTLQS